MTLELAVAARTEDREARRQHALDVEVAPAVDRVHLGFDPDCAAHGGEREARVPELARVLEHEARTQVGDEAAFLVVALHPVVAGGPPASTAADVQEHHLVAEVVDVRVPALLDLEPRGHGDLLARARRERHAQQRSEEQREATARRGVLREQ
jgi:hypothetical protein